MRHLMLFTVLLLGTSWAAAQSYPKQETAGNNDAQKTVTGCLSSSAGTYTLTDKSGKTYQLAGDTAKLSEHVGHQIKVTGTMSSATASSSDATTGQTGAGPTLEINSVKHVSKSCEGKGSSSY
ncbi:MAG: proteophosphoglycan 5 [Candidatus Sulfotelmatobacter sp.]|nr:proteophosphoglycan 5 [Candidatus Sulfotelmatobacter sp.]